VKIILCEVGLTADDWGMFQQRMLAEPVAPFDIHGEVKIFCRFNPPRRLGELA
jgi:hypothetical protein